MDGNVTQEQIEAALAIGNFLLSIKGIGGQFLNLLSITGTWVDLAIYWVGIFDFALPYILPKNKAEAIPIAIRFLKLASTVIGRLIQRAELSKKGLSPELDND